MEILRTAGLKLLIWEMLGNLLLLLSVICLSLGRLKADGGVMLGSDLLCLYLWEFYVHFEHNLQLCLFMCC